MQSAYFATACEQHSTELASFLSEFLDELGDGEDVGVEPYQVPRRLIDPKFVTRCFCALGFCCDWCFFRTGDLLLDPVLPDNPPHPHTFVNEASRDYFESQAVWPTGSFTSSIPHFSTVM